MVDQVAASDAAMEAETSVQPIKDGNSPGTPPMTFQERIALERKRNGEGEGEGQSPG
jgi:hypothetical protein